MTRAYDEFGPRSRHPLPDVHMLVVSASTVAGIAAGPSGVVAALVVALAAGLAAPQVRRVLVLACLVTGVLGWVAGEQAWAGAVPRQLGPYRGWAEVAADPVAFGIATRITIEVDRERFDAWAYGSMGARLAARQSGEYIWVEGERRASTGDVRRARVRHVVGRFDLRLVGDTLPGNGVAVAGNRVRGALRRSAARTMSADDAALFTGLVIGDDARQSAAMVQAFRAAGLSHLTAVSGQNVGFLLAAASPLLRRLRSWWRWAATIGLIGWFMSVTRFEPSVLRAGAMAMLAATAFVLGRDVRPLRMVAIAVTGLVLADPMLVWSVGFWLSVGATLGVCVAGPWWMARLPGPHWFRLSLGVTLGAQAGVALPSLLVFHRLPVLAPVANLAAVPVAGAVMLYGLPAGLVAAVLPDALCRLVMMPAVVGTRWTATVAAVAAALSPTGGWSVAAWVAAAGMLLVLLRWGRVPS